MPELAETIRIAVDLAKLNDNKIEEVIIHDDRCLDKNFKKELLVGCETRWMTFGKYVAKYLCDFETIVVFRLGMTGRFLAKSAMKDIDYKHIILELKMRSHTIYYVDYRKFSRVSFIKESEFKNLKQYSLASSYDQDESFTYSFQKKPVTRRPKIVEMLDEGKLTGVGNYLANESLGELDLNPYTPFESAEEKQKVYEEVQKIAKNSFHSGGNTFNGGYIRLYGERGTFKCKFYGDDSIKKKYRGRPLYTRWKNE